MVAEAVFEELKRRGHEGLLFFSDSQLDTPERKDYYSRPEIYHFWRFPIEREGKILESFPLMIADPNPRSGQKAWTFRDLTDELLEFYFEELERELKKVIEDFRPDIVECQHIWAIPYIIHELGLPYVVTAHHSDQMGYRYDRRMQSYANRAAKGARWIFAISSFVKEEVLELYPDVDPEKVIFLENGYNQRIFKPQSVDRGGILRKVGVEDTPDLPIITFSGKISHTKGVDTLLKANRKIQEEQKVLLLIAGTGSLEKEFSEEVRAQFHYENVWFLDHQPQTLVAELHNIAKVSVIPSRSEGFGLAAVIPSRSEGFGLAALEALGCGTPVVSTRCGGPESFVIGDIVPVDDPEALGGALLKILALEGSEEEELRKAALEQAKRYSWEEIVERRLHYYNQMLISDKRDK
jgi:glycosyltransferase involved in cell wall biosynthesis